MRARYVVAIAVAAGLVGAGAAGWWWYRSQARSQAKTETVPPPQFVSGSFVSYAGKIRAQQVVQVPAPAEGEVQEYLAEVGDEVYEGQLLARIRNQQLEGARELANEELERAQGKVNSLETELIAARLEESRASADAARSTNEKDRLDKIYQRQRLLYREGATPRLVYEKAEREAAAAQKESETLGALAQHSADRVEALTKELEFAKSVLEEKNQELDHAKQDLSATEVTSPVDGILVGRRGSAGELVTPDMPDLLQIAIDLGSLEAVVQMPPDVARRLKPGQLAAVQVAEMGGEPLAGTVKSVQGAELIVAFTSPNPAIRPGTTAQIRVQLP